MADTTVEQLATTSPVTVAITGEEPIETEIGAVGHGARLRQLSSLPLVPLTVSSNLLITDQGKCITMDVAVASVLTIPTNAGVGFPIGATLLVRQIGLGSTSIAAAGGVTIEKRASVGLVLAEQFATVMLHKIDTDIWHLSGELQAV